MTGGAQITCFGARLALPGQGWSRCGTAVPGSMAGSSSGGQSAARFQGGLDPGIALDEQVPHVAIEQQAVCQGPRRAKR